MLLQTPNRQLNEPSVIESGSFPNCKPIVIGLYGLPGSGKTFLFDQLKQELGQNHFAFYEGSEVIAAIVPGGLDAFQKLEELEKVDRRQLAIDKIRKECAGSGQVAVVAGHFMFWAESEETGCRVYTQNDLETFTHIIYLDFPADVIAKHRLNDAERIRPSVSVPHLRKWQQAEKEELRDLCRSHGILFSPLSSHPRLLNKASALLKDFRLHTETHNLSCAERTMEEAFGADLSQLETMLVMDADRTLAAEDTGALFWKAVSGSHVLMEEDYPLKKLFGGPLGYSYTAFRQAMLLYEETADDEKFDVFCQDVASMVTMHPEFVSLLQVVAENKHIGALIVTCGLRRVWDKVLEREGLSKTVKVIGGGRIADNFVVTAAVKAALVTRLRDTHQMYVWAFGDSPLDLGMLSNANQAIVIVGEKHSRSKTMDHALTSAFDSGRFRARQVVLPSNAPPRLDTITLPLVKLTEQGFVDSVLCRRSNDADIQVYHATGRNAAKLLMTPMRNATVAGPALRYSHHQVGWYLAVEFLAKLLGIEEYSIPHVQGHDTSGYRLLHEKHTSIVALMRGGEPMALGVSDAFPYALFVHASRPSDVMLHHLQGQHAVVLVDSVVNSGKTVVDFVQHIRLLHASIRIVVAAGVVQCQSVPSLAQALAGHADLSLVALRLSDNKFTGTGTVDTGNRLFNTTHLP